MLRRFVFAALFVSAGVALAADGPVPGFVPPATRAVIGFHLRSVIDSSLLKSLGGDWFKDARASWNSASPIPGIDPLKDLDEVVIASTMEGDHPPLLVICRGRFPMEEMSKGAEMYHGVPIRAVQDGDALALLDAGTMIAGAMKDVRDAIDRRDSAPEGVSAELAGRAAELSGRYAIWGVGSLPADFHPPSAGPDGFKSLDRFDFGLALNDGLEIAATLHVRQPEDAQKLAMAMQFLEMMAKSQPDAGGTKVETHVDNGTLTVAVAIPEETLKKAIEQQGAAIAQAFANGQAQAKKAAPAKPALARPPVPSGPLAAASPARPLPQAAAAPPAPSKETKIVSDKEGTSTLVTLPGKR